MATREERQNIIAQLAPQGQVAAPFEVVGVNGQSFQVPTISAPAMPDIQVPDYTGQFLARANESVSNAFDIQQRTLDTGRQAAQAEAASRSRNTFGQAVSGISDAVNAGLTIYRDIKTLESEKLAAEQQALQNQLAAELEDQIRGHMVEVERAFAMNTQDEGLIPTYTAAMRELRHAAIQRGLDPAVAQSIMNVGWESITNVQRQQGQRWISEVEDSQAALRQTQLFEAMTNITGTIASMKSGPYALDPNAGMEEINLRLAEYLANNSIQGVEALHVLNGVYPTVISALEEAGLNTNQFITQQDTINRVLENALTINQQYSGNAEMRNLQFARLQAELDRQGIQGVNLTDIFQTDVQRLEQQLSLQGQIQSLQQAQRNAPRQLTQQMMEAENAHAIAMAHSWIIDPRGNAVSIEEASGDGADPAMRGAYRVYQDYQEDASRLEQWNEQLRSLSEDEAQLLADLQLIADKVDPTGRLGQPTTTFPYTNQIIELIGDERPNLSDEAAQALARVEGARQRNIHSERQEVQSRRDNLLAQWRAVGIDLLNISDTSQTEARLEGYLPVLEEARQYQQPPPLTPMDFLPGLPPLPQR
jgi:hypothetical protein